ncbi:MULTISPECIES: DUF6507 family protein [unclassified Streptomyces]|uniref:DUF6507 family protein n=1 Tax=unclassified Streptomyces TaxID=2593676 RepID=UPI002257C9C9|nr:DUF6507 family protein [Streptomyces sp. NBC_01500]MCX4550042.1 DUF6507 family protein [Streptomyces sp. NBC_01500]WSV55503.1 DUF6507 family protein [Streptomyces sp. NBC_01014]
MTGWDISAAGVAGTLNVTWDAADVLAAAVKSLDDDLHSAATSSGTIAVGGYPGDGTTGLVASALGEFVNSRQTTLKAMAVRTGNALNGAAIATNAYQAGNLQMAADTQREVVRDSDLDVPKAIKAPGAK